MAKYMIPFGHYQPVICLLYKAHAYIAILKLDRSLCVALDTSMTFRNAYSGRQTYPDWDGQGSYIDRLQNLTAQKKKEKKKTTQCTYAGLPKTLSREPITDMARSPPLTLKPDAGVAMINGNSNF